MHPLLKKQIEEFFGNETAVPNELQGFISAVNVVFEQTVKAENELFQSEDQMRKIFNGTSDAIFILDPRKDRIVDANPRAVELLGYSREQLLAMPASFMHPNQIEEIKAFTNEVVNNGYGWTNELTCTTKYGIPLPSEMSASVIDFDNQKMVLSIVRDISGRIEAEEALLDQQVFLRQVIDTNPSLVFAKDQDGKYTLANKAMAAAMNSSVEEVIGQTDYPFNPDQKRVEGYKRQDQHVFNTGNEFVDPEEHSIGRDGKEYYRRIVKRPLYDQEGSITQILGIVNDITPLKLAEQALISQNRSLEIISNISREISLTTSLDELLNKASQAIMDMLGVTSNSIYNWNPSSSASIVLAKAISEEASKAEKEVTLGTEVILADRLPEINAWLHTSKEPKFINGEETLNNHDNSDIKTALYVPILLEDKTFGYIEIFESRDTKNYTQTEIDFLQALAAQLGIAFDNDNLFSALQSSEERFRTLIENLSFFITILDSRGKVIYASPTSNLVLGFPAEDFLGENIFRYIHKEDRRRMLELTNSISISPTLEKEVQYRFVRSDGKIVHLESTINVLQDQSSDNTQFIVSSFDVTDQLLNRDREQEQFERRGKQALFTNQVTKQISLAKTRADLYSGLTQALHKNLDVHYHHVQFFRYNPASNQLELVAAAGPQAELLLTQRYQIDMHQGVSGRAAGQSTSVLVQDTQSEPGWMPTPMITNTKSEMSTPVMLGDELLGVINIQSTELEDFDNDIQVLLDVLSGQIAVATDSIRLHAEMEERIEELNVLQQYTSSEGWDSFHKSTPLATTGYSFDPLEDNPSALSNETMDAEELLTSNFIKPMLVQGQRIGTIGIETDPNQPLSPEEQSLLDEISSEVSEALERARLFEASQRSAAELAVLNDMGQAFTEALNEQAIVENIFTYASKLLEIDQFFVALIEEEDQILHFPLVYQSGAFVQVDNPADPNAATWQPRTAGAGLTGHIVTTRQPILIESNAEEVLATLNLPYIQEGQMTESWVGVPMTVGERVIGVINAQSELQAGLYNDHHLGLLTSIAGQASIAIDNARLFDQEQKRAEQERLVRTITDRVRRGGDREAILKIALEEISNAMQSKKSVIKLGSVDKLKSKNIETTVGNSTSNGHTTEEA